LIPVSAHRYLAAKRKAEEHAKAQNGKGSGKSKPASEGAEPTRLSTRS
jgi:CDP-diacylglycerol--serine O-phosphatidyltransferase